jgi:hypothetical protein
MYFETKNAGKVESTNRVAVMRNVCLTSSPTACKVDTSRWPTESIPIGLSSTFLSGKNAVK